MKTKKIASQAKQSLNGLFTEAEFIVMLNTTCSSNWGSSGGTSVATLVADDNGIDSWSDVPEGSMLHGLLQKLVELDSLQNAALFDLCARAWRNLNKGSLGEVLEGLGSSLKAEGK